jgi:hypothetical protein
MRGTLFKRFYSGWFTTKVYLYIFVSYIILQLGVWLLDNKIPLEVNGPAQYEHAVPGAQVKLKVPVTRTRYCNVLISRYMLDSEGTYYDLMATRFLSEDSLTQLAEGTPYHAEFSFTVPPNAVPGPATVVTQLAYMCNPLQAIWPLDFALKTKITIEASP